MIDARPGWSLEEAGLGTIAIISAFYEQERVGHVVGMLRGQADVDEVVVVDDGSPDHTFEVARAAGAIVVRHPNNSGKASAIVSGAEVAAALDQRDGLEYSRPLLLLDADLGSDADAVIRLLQPVLSGHADMTIGLLPPSKKSGGYGRVVRFARWAVLRTTGVTVSQPLSGQRAITRQAFDAARPLAARFGVEVGLTIDTLRSGFRVVEIPLPATHRVTGRAWRDRLHRAGQMIDVIRAVWPRLVWHDNPSPRLRARRVQHAVVQRVLAGLR